MGQTYDKLKAAGLSYELKPNRDEAIASAQILADSGISELSACILQAWLGGAHDEKDPAFYATSQKLSAQWYCGDKVGFTDIVLGRDNVYYCLGELAKIDSKAAELVESAAKAKAKASAKKQDAEAQADAQKIYNEALSAVGVGAIGLGTVVTVVAVAYLVFMANTAK
jgi:hypothetical protein